MSFFDPRRSSFGGGGGSLPTLTPNKAIETDGAGAIVSSAVSSTELNYLSGVTSAIQTQINGKQANLPDAANFELAQNRGSAGPVFMDLHSEFPATDWEARFLRWNDAHGGAWPGGLQILNKVDPALALTSNSAGIIIDYADGEIKYARGSSSYKIWNEYNDGSGSGLDADLLDGMEASQFAWLAGTQTITGAKTFSSVLTMTSYMQRTSGNGVAVWHQQDGTGRSIWYWNTLGGSPATYDNAGPEGASAITHHSESSYGVIFFRVAPQGTAGNTITWERVLSITGNSVGGVRLHYKLNSTDDTSGAGFASPNNWLYTDSSGYIKSERRRVVFCIAHTAPNTAIATGTGLNNSIVIPAYYAGWSIKRILGIQQTTNTTTATTFELRSQSGLLSTNTIISTLRRVNTAVSITVGGDDFLWINCTAAGNGLGLTVTLTLESP
ncbi:hypothetical protein [uncultured Sphaerochaeta sp.]|uniref:hypothetical protein n=1 Tax=uncultured Sphaerochaeta sp. TaxID=886478 RepID=UPI0026126C6E|nr:hypothetical protein [uncultured Sphaerochaeta sp.]